MGSFKRKVKMIGGTVASGTLGFIHGGVAGAIVGGIAGNRIVDAVLDKNGNQEFNKDKLVKLGKDGLRTIKFANKYQNPLYK